MRWWTRKWNGNYDCSVVTTVRKREKSLEPVCWHGVNGGRYPGIVVKNDTENQNESKYKARGYMSPKTKVMYCPEERSRSDKITYKKTNQKTKKKKNRGRVGWQISYKCSTAGRNKIIGLTHSQQTTQNNKVRMQRGWCERSTPRQMLQDDMDRWKRANNITIQKQHRR